MDHMIICLQIMGPWALFFQFTVRVRAHEKLRRVCCGIFTCSFEKNQRSGRFHVLCCFSLPVFSMVKLKACRIILQPLLSPLALWSLGIVARLVLQRWKARRKSGLVSDKLLANGRTAFFASQVVFF